MTDKNFQLIVARSDGNQRALELSPLAFRCLFGLLEASTARLGMGSEPPGVSEADWDEAEAAMYPLVEAFKELLTQPELSPAEQAMADGRAKTIFNIIKDLQTVALLRERHPEAFQNILKLHAPR